LVLPPLYGPPPLVVELPQAAINMTIKMLRAITLARLRNIAFSPSMCLLLELWSPEERSHQSALPKLTIVAGYTLLEGYPLDE